MSTVTSPINAPVTAQHKLNHRAVDAGIKSFAAGKVDTSAVPTNQVEATWQDALDIVNPLQQIPVVSDIYRTVSGEKISGLARVAGGFLWGGITGGFAAAYSAAYAENNHDQSPGEQMVAALFGTDNTPATPDMPPPTMLADATPAPTPSPSLLAPAAPASTPTTPPSIAEATPEPAAAAQLAATTTPTPPAAPAPQPGAKPEQLPAGQPVFSASLPHDPSPAPARTAGLTITEAQSTPLRDRLNRKNPSPVQPNTRPLDQFATGWTAKTGTSFLSQIPANAATLAAAQQQNLQLLQGVADIPPPAATPNAPATAAAVTPLPAPHDAELNNAAVNDAALNATTMSALTADTTTTDTTAAGTILAPAATGQHNPLPLQLVQDMMLQALDKYQAMHAPAAATNGLGLH